jgi:hypothetical protein
MFGEDQERFEDYLELERYIEELQAGHTAHPPSELTPEHARIYYMLMLLRSASAEGAAPRTEFTVALQMRLEQELQKRSKIRPFPFLREKAHTISRHPLITGGIIVANSLVMGIASEWIAERIENHKALHNRTATTLQIDATYIAPQEGVPTIWYLVTTLALLDQEPQPFTTDTIVGFVVREDGENANLRERNE